MFPGKTVALTCGLMLTLLAALLPAGANAAGPHPSLAATGGDELVPGFRWGVGAYGARCGGDGLALAVNGASGWKVAIGGDAPRGGNFDSELDLASGEGAEVEFRRRGGERRTAFIRCLPGDMILPDFDRVRKGGPALYAIQTPPSYGVVMTRAGAPVWWLRSGGFPFDTEIYRDGTMAWNQGGQGGNVDFGLLEFRTLTGRVLRTVTPPDGGFVDVHDHLVLPNGNELVGVPTYEDGVDLTAYGGSSDARVRNTAVEELTPDGDLVRRWDSEDHIGLDETVDAWWPSIAAVSPADVSHWNGIDVVGKFMYLSFRHLDAIYKVNRKTGRIVWKLGGTETGKSLEIRGDSRKPQHFNGQHDVNVLDDGTITLFDNSTAFGGHPRALRFRIDEDRGVARMIDEVTDPRVVVSGAGGSARRTGDGWLINWGVSNPGVVGAYDDRGRPLFRMTYPVGATYRANPVPGAVSFGDLWRAMNRIGG
jgi:hypothetical protein